MINQNYNIFEKNILEQYYLDINLLLYKKIILKYVFVSQI